jgi:hypothetical protein
MPKNKALDLVEPDELADYLHLNGWKETRNAKKGWRVFLGDKADDGEPFEVIIPQRRSLEGNSFLASSINLLSQLTDEAPELVLQRIQNRNQDVLQIYDLKSEHSAAISLGAAAVQVTSMKNLVGYGALSEKNALPYYQRSVVSTSRMLRRYQFGHTIRGSFGFTIIAPVREPPNTLHQTRMFDENDSLEIVIAPVERRVMERIVRGLHITVDATRSHQPEGIAQHYPSGFNGNMCSSIVSLSNNKDIPLEYRILWSPRIVPSQDLVSASIIRTNRLEYASLETAAIMLKKTEPQRVVIRGRITGLSSSERPLSGEAQRNVVINWIGKDRPGPSKVLTIIDLPENYSQALRWHEDWDIIEVTGYLQRTGNYWRLNDPTGFRVVG